VQNTHSEMKTAQTLRVTHYCTTAYTYTVHVWSFLSA